MNNLNDSIILQGICIRYYRNSDRFVFIRSRIFYSRYQCILLITGSSVDIKGHIENILRITGYLAIMIDHN